MTDISHQRRGAVPPRPGAKRSPGRPAPAEDGRKRRPPRPGRRSTRQVMRARRNRARLAVVSGVAVVAVLAALLTAYATGGGGTAPAKNVGGIYAVTAQSLQPVEAVAPAGLFNAANRWPKTAQAPIALPATTPALSTGGKPEVLYIGANYCPYCAAERWAMLMALSKFGTFSGLRGTASSATDPVNPGTPTVTFAGSHFSSSYLAFVPVETNGSVAAPDGNYPALEQMTAAQTKLLATYDASPYVPAGNAGGIPFIDIGGRYYFVGSQYDASHIAGWDFERAATYLASGTNTTSRSLRVAAAYLVRDFCQLTGGKPAATCHP